MSPRDIRARAMEALHDELVLPREIEEQMLEALDGARAAAEPDRGPPTISPQRRASRFAVAAALAAMSLGGVFGGFAFHAAERGRVEIAEARGAQVDAAERAARDVAAIDWGDASPWSAKMAVLETLRLRLEALGDPEAVARVAPRYADGVRRGFLDAAKKALEAALAAGTGAWSLEERSNLKEYLLLDDAHRLETEGGWEAQRLTATCTDTVAAAGRVPAADVEPVLGPHVGTFLRLVERGSIRGLDLDAKLVARVRGVLAHAEPRRYYDVFVTPLLDEQRDPARPAGRDNLLYPPLTLDALLAVSAEGPALVESRSKKSYGAPYEVIGVYTAPARRAVLRALDAARDTLHRDAWVVGDEKDDRRAADALDQVRSDYDGLFAHEWESFLRDLQIARPPPGKEGARVLRTLAGPASPLVRVLRAVAENTSPVGDRASARDPMRQRFAAVAHFVEGSAPAMVGYRALLRERAEDLEAGRRSDKDPASQVRALMDGPDYGGRDLLVTLLSMPLEPR